MGRGECSFPLNTLAVSVAVVLTVSWCPAEPWSGGPVPQHPAGSGAQQRHLSGPAGGVSGLLQRPQGQGHHREAQGEVMCRPVDRNLSDHTLTRTLRPLSSECPAGPVHQVSAHEQEQAAAAPAGQERLAAAPRQPLGLQGAAAAQHAEDHAAQPRERHAE